MCVSPINITSNAHGLDYRALKRIRLQVPCGRCYQCRQRDGLEWSTRTYFEADSCFKNKGFVIFDTLTYSDEHVKRFRDLIPESNITAFADYLVLNKSDLSPFFRRLHRRFELDGFPVNGNLRYLICSEYGDGEEYIDFKGRVRKGTVRPHYHVLFFVNFDIDPIRFSRTVAQCWSFGKTDGVCPTCSKCPVRKFCDGRNCLYSSSEYVLKNRVFRRFTVESVNKILYVQKYISKLSPYNRLYESRLYNLMNVLYGQNWNRSASKRSIFNQYKRRFTTFHEQSQGFGFGVAHKEVNESWLDRFPTFNNDGQITIISFKNKIVEKRSLPQFMRRKLLMEKCRVFGGSSFRYKIDSLPYLVNQYRNRIERLRTDWISFMSDSNNEVRGYVSDLLAGRDVERFFEYLVAYKGRLGQITSDVIDDYLRPFYSDDGFEKPHGHTIFLRSDSFGFQYLGYKKNEKYFRKNQFQTCRHHSIELRPRTRYKPFKNVYGFQKSDDFAVNLYPLSQLRTIDERNLMFKDFDKIDSLFETWRLVKGLEKELELKNDSEVRCKRAKLFR